MKKTFALLCALLLLALSCTALAQSGKEAALTYAACTSDGVNVRISPERSTPSRGRLIHDAPVTILGESDDGSCWYCSTAYGEGYIPKQYLRILKKMTAEKFKTYCAEHPSAYIAVAPTPTPFP